MSLKTKPIKVIDANGVLICVVNSFRLEQLISESGYECKNIIWLNMYATNTNEFFRTCIDVYVPFIMKHGIKQATTLLEVKGLFVTIELEATVVK